MQIFLEPFLTIPLSRISRLLDLDLYPYRKFVGSGQCAQTVFRSLPEAATRAFFGSAAEWRFREKRNYLNGHVTSKELRFSAGVAMALGYKQHTQLFLQLFLWLQARDSQQIEERIALLLGVCGFFEAPFTSRWGGSTAYQDYTLRWKNLSQKDLPRFFLQLKVCRPYNHPIRRLVVLAFLTQDVHAQQLLDRFTAIWKACWEGCVQPKDYRQLSRELMALFPIYEHLYWNRHFLFEEQPSSKFLTLMGKDVFLLVLVNTLVPLLQENLSSPKEQQALLSFVDALTLPPTGKRRYLVHRFFGNSSQGEILDSGLMEQGAFQLHRDFCIHYESSCEGCPFVARLKKHATFAYANVEV